MVGSVVNMNGVDGERSEADGVSDADGVSEAMSAEAASRAVVGTLTRGQALTTDARMVSARRRSASSLAAPERDRVNRGVLTALTEPTVEM